MIACDFFKESERLGGLGRAWLKVKMHGGRLLLRMWRTDPTEMLFDAAAAGTRNANARTWHAALDVIGRRLQSPKLTPRASKAVVDNALVLEEAAHRYNSEDCKVRLIGRAGRRLRCAAGMSTKSEAASWFASMCSIPKPRPLKPQEFRSKQWRRRSI
jgi:hypothetical protein